MVVVKGQTMRFRKVYEDVYELEGVDLPYIYITIKQMPNNRYMVVGEGLDLSQKEKMNILCDLGLRGELYE